MAFGETLKDLRRKRKMTQEMLAHMVGTSKQTIQRYEAGVIQTPPMARVEALAMALGTSPATLMGWEEEPLPRGQQKLGEPQAPRLAYDVTDGAMAREGILPGDTVLYEPSAHVEKGRLVLVEMKGQTYLRRWYHYPQKQALLLLASDPETEPMLLLGSARTHVHLLGVVVEVQRKLR